MNDREPAFYLGLPPRKLAETFAALYALFLGTWGMLAQINGVSIFWWSPEAARASGIISAALMALALIHGAGVKINGNWRWSAMLRLAGMTGHLGIITWLAVESAGGRWTAATPNYSAWAVLFFLGWLATVRDAIRACEGRPQEWTL